LPIILCPIFVRNQEVNAVESDLHVVRLVLHKPGTNPARKPKGGSMLLLLIILLLLLGAGGGGYYGWGYGGAGVGLGTLILILLILFLAGLIPVR
jgi:hypothetical protein